MLDICLCSATIVNGRAIASSGWDPRRVCVRERERGRVTQSLLLYYCSLRSDGTKAPRKRESSFCWHLPTSVFLLHLVLLFCCCLLCVWMRGRHRTQVFDEAFVVDDSRRCQCHVNTPTAPKQARPRQKKCAHEAADARCLSPSLARPVVGPPDVSTNCD